MTKNLSQLKLGEATEVVEILSLGSMRRRLMDLGLVKGTRITHLQSNAFGDLSAYLIRGAVIALRIEDATAILVA